MKLAIMQPYFLPYIGYFQLMNVVDEFVVYDNIQYTKKGWINRNRMLINGKDAYFTVPLRKDSDFLNVKDRFISSQWDDEKKKYLNRIKEVYKKAPFFTDAYSVLSECFLCDEKNLFQFILHSLKMMANHLGINTPITISSELNIDHSLTSVDKVIEICNYKKATQYINPIGGINLYTEKTFKGHGVELSFLKSVEIKYPQFENEFVPSLSILDVMMFNSPETIKEYLKSHYILQRAAQDV